MASPRRSTGLLLGAAFAADRRAAWLALLLAPLVGAATVLPGVGIAWLVRATVSGERGLLVAGVSVLLFGVLVTMGLGNAAASARIQLQLVVGRELDRRLILLSGELPTVAHHDDPEHRDRMDLLRAHRDELGGAIGALVETLRALVVVVTAAVVLAGVHPALALLPLAALPAVLATHRATRLVAVAERDTAQQDRLRRSLLDSVCRPTSAAEWRIYGASGELAGRHHELAERVRRQRGRADVRGSALATACWVFYGCCLVGVLLVVVARAAAGAAGPGDVALLVTVGVQVSGEMSGLVAMLRWLGNALRAVDHYVWLADHAAAQRPSRPAPVTTAPRPGGDLELDRVSFRYPGTDRLVLDRVSLLVPSGSTLAVVGENGAGKSTLLSLLAGIHRPTSGEIRYRGRPLADWEPAAWRSGLTGCFQDFCRLELPLRDAVGVGDLAARPDPAAATAALGRAGALDLLADLPRGIDTQLGTAYPGGTDLSGGQWQRVALARAHMRQDPALLLLDEPTASLDPATEDTLLTHYLTGNGEPEGTTTVVISHRFATVRAADLIAVLDGGRLVQFGAHDTLAGQPGAYAELHSLHAYGYRG